MSCRSGWRRLFRKKSTNAASSPEKLTGQSDQNRMDDAVVVLENLNTKMELAETREDRLKRRERIREHDEEVNEDISKEEEDQIKRAIALSMLEQSGSDVNHTTKGGFTQNSLPQDDDAGADSIEENKIQSASSQGDDHQLGDEDDQVLCNRDGDGDIDKHQGDVRICSPVDENEDSPVSLKERDEVAAFDEDGDDERSSPLLFQTPSCDSEPDDVVIDDDKAALESQLSNSVPDIFALRKDRLSLRKRKLQVAELERPSKTPRIETSDDEGTDNEMPNSMPELIDDVPEKTVPLMAVDRRPVLKSLKPFFAPDTKDKGLYSCIIFDMLNNQLERFRNAQRQLKNYAKMGKPVEVGPFMRGCLKHRKRNEKPFVFFDSEDELETTVKESSVQTVKKTTSASVLTREPDGTISLAEGCVKTNSRCKRRMRDELEDSSDLSDFEINVKKPKLTEENTSPEKSILEDKNIENPDEDDVLYGGETLPFGDDEEVNEELEDTLLSDSPVPIIVKESDIESDGNHKDADVKNKSDGKGTSELVDSSHNTNTLHYSDGESQNGPTETDQNKSTEKSSSDYTIKPEKPVSYEEQRLIYLKRKRESWLQKSGKGATENLEDDAEMLPNVENHNDGQFEDGNESDASSGSGSASVVILDLDKNSQGFFARKLQSNSDINSKASSSRNEARGRSPVIELQNHHNQNPNEEQNEFEPKKEEHNKNDGISCPMCNVCFPQDKIERHAAECDGPIEEAVVIEAEVTDEVLNFDPQSQSGSSMKQDSETDWVFKDTKKTPVATYTRLNKQRNTKFTDDLYRVSDSDEDVQPLEVSQTNPHGSDHIDQVLSEMIGKKELSISIPKLTTGKKERVKRLSKHSDPEDEFEKCFICFKLIPKSEYPQHVNEELEKQNQEESLHVESQVPSELKETKSSTSTTHQQGKRLRSTGKRTGRNTKKEDTDDLQGNLDDLIAFSKEKTQDEDNIHKEDDNDDEDDFEIDEDESDDVDTKDVVGESNAFEFSDSPVKAFRSIKNSRAGFIDYKNQFSKKQGGVVSDRSLYPTTSNPQDRGRGRGRGRGKRIRGKSRKKK